MFYVYILLWTIGFPFTIYNRSDHRFALSSFHPAVSLQSARFFFRVPVNPMVLYITQAIYIYHNAV